MCNRKLPEEYWFATCCNNMSPAEFGKFNLSIMEDLIEALQIFMKYCGDVKYPTTCEHEELFVNCVTPEQVSEEDTKRLDELGFFPYEDFAFVSYRFGDN